MQLLRVPLVVWVGEMGKGRGRKTNEEAAMEVLDDYSGEASSHTRRYQDDKQAGSLKLRRDSGLEIQKRESMSTPNSDSTYTSLNQ